MKNLKVFALLTISLILCACTISQTSREDVSFEGLKSFYVQAPQGGSEFFKEYNERVTQTLVAEIVNNLTAKGFVNVADESQAQIIFKPIWNVTFNSAIQALDVGVPTPREFDAASTTRGMKFYATLEIQAFRKGDGFWGWRGFSPLETDIDNITSAMLKNQVTWALEKFPPEKYGSASSIIDIFHASNVTASEIEAKEKEVAIAEKAKATQKQQARENATKRAQEKIEKSTKKGEQAKAPTQKQIEAEMKPETIADIEKAFEKAFKNRAKK